MVIPFILIFFGGIWVFFSGACYGNQRVRVYTLVGGACYLFFLLLSLDFIEDEEDYIFYGGRVAVPACLEKLIMSVPVVLGLGLGFFFFFCTISIFLLFFFIGTGVARIEDLGMNYIFLEHEVGRDILDVCNMVSASML